MKTDLEFFDCNCSYGVTAIPAFRYAKTVSELRAEMSHCGIRRALVRYAGQRYESPLLWNRRAIEDLKGQSGLFPCWSVLPPQTGEQPPTTEFLQAMRDVGVRALWAFPQEHRYSLDSLTFGELFEELAKRRIPLFVKDIVSNIANLMRECPLLTAVAVNQGPHSLERYLRPLLDRYPNLYLDTSYYIVDGLIEEFCNRYGPERLLFGSGFPDNCSGGSLLCLLHANINDAARADVAGSNLQRLLNEADL
jgi:uncharacterized protein